MGVEFLQEKEREFVEQGYVIFKKLYSQKEIEQIYNLTLSLMNLIKEIDYPHDNKIHKIDYKGTQFVLQFKEDNTIIHRIVWASGAQPELLSLSRAPQLLEIIATLLQSNQADHLINSIHPKLSQDSVEFKIHQDEFHRKNYDPGWVNLNNDRSYVVCITAVDNMISENGGIYVIPYSHKLGFISADEMSKLDLNQAIAPEIAPGDTFCMNQDLVHFSLPNESSLSRIILINGFSVVGANHNPYPGEGSAQLVELVSNNSYLDEF